MSWDNLNPRSWYTLHLIAKDQAAARLEPVLFERLRHWRPVNAQAEQPADLVELRIQLSASGNAPATHKGGSGPMESAAIKSLVETLENLPPDDSAAIVTTITGAQFWNSREGFGASGQATFDDCRAMFSPPLEILKPSE